MRWTCISILCCLLVAGAVLAENIPSEERTRMRQTRETMTSLHRDLLAYAHVNDEFPATLQVLVDMELREELPVDAWGRAFVYESDGDDFRLVSYGADGEAGGTGANADIVFTGAGQELTEAEREALAVTRDRAWSHAKVVVTRERMKVAGLEVARHRAEEGSWPDLEAFVAGLKESEPQLARCFRDAWGNGIELRVLPHDSFALLSRGADGEPGGSGEAADIVVTEREVRLELKHARERANYWRGSRHSDEWRMRTLHHDIVRFRQQNGELPERMEDLLEDRGQGSIRDSIPSDAWGHEFTYVREGDEFFIVTLGKDGRPGGTGENAPHIHPRPGTKSEQAEDSDGVARQARREQDDMVNEMLAEVAVATLESLRILLLEWHGEHGEYPETLEDIAGELPGEVLPTDPWGNAFQYERDEDGTDFRLVCLGSNGEPGGTGHAAEIVFNREGQVEPDNGPADDPEAEEVAEEDGQPEPEARPAEVQPAPVPEE
jgi:hypothetical protein